MQQNKHFLPTKFKSPILSADFLSRQRIHTLLKSAVQKPVTIVHAPPGYGKSTAVSDFLQHQPFTKWWVTLTPQDDDPQRFISAILHAIYGEAAYPPQQITPDILVNILQDALDGEETAVLVLDDYHHIQQATIIFFMLMQVIDARLHNLRLIITSRALSSETLPLTQWRLGDHLSEITSTDLRFNEEEMAQFVTDADPADLAQQTEGWIAGLKLHKLLGSQAPAAASDYLFAEVFKQQAPHIQTFLLQIAAVDEFCAPLCQAMTGRTDSTQIINQLLQGGLFITPLDNGRRWFRFHQLFLDMLRSNASDNQAAHQAASHWYEEQGYFTQAVQQAVTAADWPRAIHLMKQYGRELTEQGDIYQLRAWSQMLPTGSLEQHPQLCLTLALPFVVTGHIPQAMHYLHSAEKALENQPDSPLTAELNALYAVATLIQGDINTTLARLSHAQPHLSPHSIYKPIALMTEGLVAFGSMALNEAQQLMQQAYQAALRLEDAATLVMAQGHYADINILSGRLDLAYELFQHNISAEFSPDQLPVFARAYQGMAHIHLLRGEFQQTLMMAQRCLTLAQPFGLINFILPAWLMTARAHQLLGNAEQSIVASQTAFLLHHQFPNLPGSGYLDHTLRYALTNGEYTSAEALVALSPLGAELPDFLLWPMISETLVLSWLWIMTDKSTAALELLGRLEQVAQQAGHQLALAEVWLLRALAQAEMGQKYAASLQTALELSEPLQNVTIFLEKGEPLGRLLRAQGNTPYARHLLQRMTTHQQTPSALLDPLTEREQGLLELIAAGLSNQAIADQLVLSLSTVKWHLNNLYSKLAVRRRTEALVKARELGLIR